MKYVGDGACVKCHRGICTTYHAHPMGRSADDLSDAEVVEKFPDAGSPNVSTGPIEMRVEKSPGGVSHHIKVRESTAVEVPELTIPIHVAIGSGTRGRSYLSVTDGYVWQSPVSWYGPQQRWGVSPGFDVTKALTWPVDTPCIYCHTGPVNPVAGTENRFREPLFPLQAAIGCERCHGPGELHVAERSRDLVPAIPDTSIVNPRHLPPALQLAVCEQCHLQGKERVVRRGLDLFDYRPGLPFELFVSVYVRQQSAADRNDSVGQFEQMEQSRCFTKSGGRMVCTSCHDPHAVPGEADKDAYYREQCVKCHSPGTQVTCSKAAAERETVGDSCVTCHMPKSDSTSIAHASVTNHRILRTTDSPARAPDPFSTLPLVRFRPGLGVPQSELRRDSAVAFTRFTGTTLPNAPGLRGVFREVAITPLKEAVARSPEDVEAWVALVRAHIAAGDGKQAVNAAQAAIRSNGESAAMLSALTEAAVAAGDQRLVVESAGRWSGVSPQSPDPLYYRAAAHFEQRAWAESEADWRAVLKLDPFVILARLHLAVCLHRQGDETAGEQQARTAAQLEPDPAASTQMMEWYRKSTK